MKKILYLTITLLFLQISTANSAEFLMIMSNGSNTGDSYPYKIVKYNSTTGVETILKTFTATSMHTNQTFLDEYNSKLYIANSSDTFTVYDIVNNSISTEKVASDRSGANSGLYVYQYGWDGASIISQKEDGSTHIGENSLVTQEVDGVQQLYATDSSSNQIDINIKSGTNLLIGGINVMTSINTNTASINTNTASINTNTSKIDNLSIDISGVTAMGAALAALPIASPDAAYTCGIGTGLHDSSSALAAGCAADFANFAFADNLPKIFQTASFNIGSSFLMNGEPDLSEARDTSIKAGITFKFGSPKKIKVADITQLRTENKIDAVMLQNKKVMDENATLKKQLANNSEKNQLLEDQIAAINLKLETLNMVASN